MNQRSRISIRSASSIGVDLGFVASLARPGANITGFTHFELTFAEKWLEAAGIICNKNAILNDPRPPKVTSGIRLGTPAVTTRGLKETEMATVASFIDRAIGAKDNADELAKVRREVADLCARFPMPH